MLDFTTPGRTGSRRPTMLPFYLIPSDGTTCHFSSTRSRPAAFNADTALSACRLLPSRSHGVCAAEKLGNGGDIVFRLGPGAVREERGSRSCSRQLGAVSRHSQRSRSTLPCSMSGGTPSTAAIYVAASVFLSLVGLFVGMWAVRMAAR